MENNLSNIKCDIIFVDCTHKIVPPGLRNYKFLVILGFVNSKNKLILYLYSLINHENKENFVSVFVYLKIKYDFAPKYGVTDFQKVQISAIGPSFPQSKII